MGIKGIWCDMGGLLQDDANLISVSCGRGDFRGESHEDTLSRFVQLMHENGFETDEFGCVLNMDADRFKKVMKEAGWVNEFIAIGP